MKKILSILLAAVMAAALMTGCSVGGGTAYTILDETLKDEEYAIAFRKGDFALRDEVQKQLVELKKDGTLSKISKKWFGEDKITVKEEFTPSADATDGSLQKIKDKNEFVLGFDEALPPMGFRSDEWGHDGFDIEVAKAVCEKMGVPLKLRPISWSAKDQELNTGNIDCIWNGFTVTEEREEQLTLSEPYMVNRQVVVTLEGSGIEKLEDLKGKRVVLQNGSTAEDALNSREDIVSTLEGGAPIKMDNNVLALNDLKKGGCDAVVMDEVVAKYYVSHQDKLDEAVKDASAAESE